MGYSMQSIYGVSSILVDHVHTKISIHFYSYDYLFVNNCRLGGDFQHQFPSTIMNASDVLTGLNEYIAPGSTVFIATNERNRSYFTSIENDYDVIFLDDFSELLTSISKFMIRDFPLDRSSHAYYCQSISKTPTTFH